MYNAIIGYPIAVRGYSTERGFQISRGFGVIVDQFGFLSQPQSKTVDEYSLATFSCEMTGGVAPYTYQWKKNGVNVGTNSAALSFTAAAADKNASITVTVTDSVGAVITSTPVVLGVTSYAFKLDGVTQYYQLSDQISLGVGDLLKVRFRAPTQLTTGRRYIFSLDADYGTVLYLNTNGTFGVSQGAAYLDSSLIDGGTMYPLDGGIHEVYLDCNSAFHTSIVGAQWTVYGSSTTRQFKGELLDLSLVVNGVTELLIPLNNKQQGSIQLPTIGTVSASILNYNPAGWTPI